MKRALLVALAACHHAPAPATPAPDRPASSAAPATRTPGPATVVVTLAPHTATAILDGPFLVTTINPAGDLELALAPSATHDCGDAHLLWFGYSGGGVAAGAGQTLCARSGRDAPRTQGFSGHD